MRILLLAAFLSACAALPPTIPSTQLSKVWRLTTQSGGHGTAFPISSNHQTTVFLTVDHLIEDPDATYTVAHTDGRTLTGTVLSQHDALDAALLAFPTEAPIQVLELSYVDLELGERVYACGAQGSQPDDVRMWATTGLASSRERSGAPMYPGGSGSPLMRADGKVCALLRGIYIGMKGEFVTHHAAAIPMSDLREWVAASLREN